MGIEPVIRLGCGDGHESLSSLATYLSFVQ